jgi:hypothetical protein
MARQKNRKRAKVTGTRFRPKPRGICGPSRSLFRFFFVMWQDLTVTIIDDQINSGANQVFSRDLS